MMAKTKSAKPSQQKKANRNSKNKTPKKKPRAGHRELVNTGRDKRFVRRGAKGQFQESDDVSRSLATDRRRKATKQVRAGYGDKGDR